MGVRREGREAAVQYLYLRDLSGDCNLLSFYKFRGLSPAARRFCDTLVHGATEHLKSIDETIKKSTQNYEINRISVVDRNVLRVALFEMFHCPDTPPVVSINEAIEIAKKYTPRNRAGSSTVCSIRSVTHSTVPPARPGPARPAAKGRRKSDLPVSFPLSFVTSLGHGSRFS